MEGHQDVGGVAVDLAKRQLRVLRPQVQGATELTANATRVQSARTVRSKAERKSRINKGVKGTLGETEKLGYGSAPGATFFLSLG